MAEYFPTSFTTIQPSAGVMALGDNGTGPVNIDMSLVTTNYAVVANIGTLEAATVSTLTQSTCYVQGYYANGDGGGVFVAGASGGISNGGTIINDSSGRTWYRLYSGSVDVKWFGAKGDGITDDSIAFQDAVNALPTMGGTIVVPVTSASYYIVTPPTWGTKSISWNIDPAATFSGAGTIANGSFPRAVTNVSMYPVGPFIQSQSTTVSTAGNATGAFVVEVLQPAGVNGGAVGIYGAAQGSNDYSGSNLWAANFLVQANTGAGNGVWGIEVDVNAFSDTPGIEYMGIDVTGIGTTNPNYGVLIQRADTTFWLVGQEIRNSSLALNIPAGSSMTRGIAINSPLVFPDTLISGQQMTNGGDSLIVQRNTDTAPTGYILRAVNAANTQNLFELDVNGILTNTASIINSTQATAGALQITDMTAGAGANIKLTGDGTTTPTKYLRVTGGVFEIVNSAYNGIPLSLNDSGNLTVSGTINTGGYTVETLPVAAAGGRAYVTDATTPTFLGPLTGGGTTVTPVFYNGTAWVAG